MSSEALLRKLNANSYVPFIKLSDLTVDVPYRITRCQMLNTKFGRKVCVVLNEQVQLSLPSRVTSKVDETNGELLEYLDSGKVQLISHGMKPSPISGRNMYDLEFREVPASV